MYNVVLVPDSATNVRGSRRAWNIIKEPQWLVMWWNMYSRMSSQYNALVKCMHLYVMFVSNLIIYWCF